MKKAFLGLIGLAALSGACSGVGADSAEAQLQGDEGSWAANKSAVLASLQSEEVKAALEDQVSPGEIDHREAGVLAAMAKQAREDEDPTVYALLNDLWKILSRSPAVLGAVRLGGDISTPFAECRLTHNNQFFPCGTDLDHERSGFNFPWGDFRTQYMKDTVFNTWVSKKEARDLSRQIFKLEKTDPKGAAALRDDTWDLLTKAALIAVDNGAKDLLAEHFKVCQLLYPGHPAGSPDHLACPGGKVIDPQPTAAPQESTPTPAPANPAPVQK